MLAKPIAERRAWKSLRNKLIALHEREPRRSSGTPEYSTYIIEVEAVRVHPEWSFYVGQCFGDPEKRLQEHRSGSGRNRAAKMFRHSATTQPQYRAVALRYDLMAGFPSYWSREAAEIAEREIDAVLNRLGFPAHSN